MGFLLSSSQMRRSLGTFHRQHRALPALREPLSLDMPGEHPRTSVHSSGYPKGPQDMGARVKHLKALKLFYNRGFAIGLRESTSLTIRASLLHHKSRVPKQLKDVISSLKVSLYQKPPGIALPDQRPQN